LQRKGQKSVVGRTREKIVETEEMIRDLGGEAISTQVDVAVDEQVEDDANNH
jgi:hypothetical protein